MAYVFNFIDRQILAILLQPIKEELGASDTAMGLLTGFAFALFYTFAGIPIARLADRSVRRSIIAAGLTVWSLLTAVSGMVRSFGELALARVGVGVGEAAFVPPAHSLISDYFPPARRATAMAVFSMGVHVGIAFGFLLGGWIAEYFGWRRAFFAVGLPGLLLAVLVRFTVREPPRGRQTDRRAFDRRRRVGAERAARPLATALVPPPGARRRAALLRRLRVRGLGAALLRARLRHADGRARHVARRHPRPRRRARLGRRRAARRSLGRGRLAPPASIFPRSRRCCRSRASSRCSARRARRAGARGARAVGHPERVWFGPVFALTQALVRPQARATASAILIFVINSIGLGLGPLAIGALNDALTPPTARTRSAGRSRSSP